ncbi:MAG: M6 family metalloprotease domain-containing protein [Bacteroidetes bacterium]|jgi:M6 family metalloprotease-like protein|nr:M6 family metalloprotease domain-containing protein [Bacteroidota bacterium]
MSDISYSSIKRTILIITAILFLFPSVSNAAWLNNEAVDVKQPDGSTLSLFATGDEFYNWLHDADQFTIIQSETDGFYYYAVIENEELVPSVWRVGTVEPAAVGLQPKINISPEKHLAIRSRMENEMQFVESGREYGRAEGTLNNLVIYIRFSDQGEFTSDTLLNYSRFNTVTPGASSVYNYFEEVSYGQLALPSHFFPVPPDEYVLSYQDEHPRAYYMPYNSVTNPEGYSNDSQRTFREHTLLVNAVEWVNINSPVPTSLDLDYDNNNRVDNVVFIIKGGTTAWSTLLWPHRWSLYSQDVYINGKKVHDYNFQLETSLASSGVGVLCHELYHSLSAPDLYRYVNNDITPVGAWDVMASNNNPPQYMNAFMRMKYGGWIENIPWIDESGVYTLNPLSSSENNAYRIPSQQSSSEYFVVEYRKKEGTFDGTLPRSGMLIYRINTNAGNGNAQGPPDEVYIFRPGGSPSSDGSLSMAVFGANYDRIEFNDYTDPNAFLQNGSPGGINISAISATGDQMTFRVDFPGEVQAGFTSDVKVACITDVIGFYDASAGIPENWEWQFDPPTVSFEQGTNANSKDPVVRFEALGNYSVELIVGNENGEDTIQQTNYITIGAEAGYFEDNFESGTFTQGSWRVENPDDSETWNVYPVNGNSGSMAAGVNFRDYFSIMQRDRLLSKPFDLTNYTNANLSFDHAYAQNASYTQVTDSLIVLVSADCGESWERIAAFGEDGTGIFATHVPTEEVFWPEVTEDWCGNGWGSACNSLDLSPWAGMSEVRIAFETVSFYGNPLLIDNIVVSQFVGESANVTPINSIEVFPNPAKDVIHITLSAELQQQELQIQLFDAQGKLVYTANSTGNLQILRAENWKAGLYLLQITGEQFQQQKKLLVE